MEDCPFSWPSSIIPRRSAHGLWQDIVFPTLFFFLYIQLDIPLCFLIRGERLTLHKQTGSVPSDGCFSKYNMKEPLYKLGSTVFFLFCFFLLSQRVMLFFFLFVFVFVIK